MTSRREQIRARLEKVNEKLTRRESLDGPDWQAYAENAPFDLAYLLAELDAGEALRKRLEEAIRWALGEVGEFGGEPPPPEGKYRQRYWWRTELRNRARLPASPVGAVPGAEKT